MNSMTWLNGSTTCDENGSWGIDSIAMMSFNTNVNWL
jgi:hypothetical protein